MISFVSSLSFSFSLYHSLTLFLFLTHSLPSQLSLRTHFSQLTSLNSIDSYRDFLNKRFFLHLDQEHIVLLSNVKSDLIKFYLVNAIKKNNKEKIAEFFGKYSHEIISESGDSATGLRSWYVLPYMEEPEKDPEFSVYFTTKWSDMLRVTLNNFLSTILLNAPPPKVFFDF